MVKVNPVLRAQVRKKQGRDRIRAVLLASGSPYVPGSNGSEVYVQFPTASGLSSPVAVPLKAVMAISPGLAVLLGYDTVGKLAVVEPDVDGQLAQGFAPILNNPADQVVNGFLDLSKAAPLITFPYPGVPLSIGIGQWIYIRDGVVTNYEGALSDDTDITSYIPASADTGCLVGLFLKTDNTVEIIPSSDKSLNDGFDLTDVQECITASSADSLPIAFWALRNGMTELANSDLFLDGRQFINVSNSTGGGGGGSEADLMARIWFGA